MNQIATVPVVRWIIRRDIERVMEIERFTFGGLGWTDRELLSVLRQRNCIGMVTEIGELVVGFMVYKLSKRRLDVINFAVDRNHRRHGVGATMVERLKVKLSQQKRDTIRVVVRESNLDAQLFFRAVGFRAVGTLRGYYEQTGEDGYEFQFARTDGWS